MYTFGAYLIEELDNAAVAVYVETGVLEVDGTDLGATAPLRWPAPDDGPAPGKSPPGPEQYGR